MSRSRLVHAIEDIADEVVVVAHCQGAGRGGGARRVDGADFAADFYELVDSESGESHLWCSEVIEARVGRERRMQTERVA